MGKHKHHGEKHFNRWRCMIARCSYPSNPNFEYYGGRGIRVCQEWKKYETFRAWCESTYVTGLTLDRKNNDLGYSPENCRWATRSEQSKNSRQTEKRARHRPRLMDGAARARNKIHGDPATRTEKKCCYCKFVKTHLEFNKSTYHPDGHSSVCRECNKMRIKKWRQAKAAREKTV